MQRTSSSGPCKKTVTNSRSCMLPRNRAPDARGEKHPEGCLSRNLTALSLCLSDVGFGSRHPQKQLNQRQRQRCLRSTLQIPSTLVHPRTLPHTQGSSVAVTTLARSLTYSLFEVRKRKPSGSLCGECVRKTWERRGRFVEEFGPTTPHGKMRSTCYEVLLA